MQIVFDAAPRRPAEEPMDWSEEAVLAIEAPRRPLAAAVASELSALFQRAPEMRRLCWSAH